MSDGERLLDKLRPVAFQIGYRMLRSVSEAEDVVQEALLRVHHISFPSRSKLGAFFADERRQKLLLAYEDVFTLKHSVELETIEPAHAMANFAAWRRRTDGGDAPPPYLRGLKDTVYVPPESTVRFIVQFGDYTDPAMPYMFHPHLLWHEDQGMMGQFVAVERGRRSKKPQHEHRSEHDRS